MNKKEYKYRLHYLLRRLSKSDYDLAMKKLPEHLGISRQTFQRWIYTRLDNESLEITGCQVLILSNFFEVKPHEIFTAPPTVVTKNELLKETA